MKDKYGNFNPETKEYATYTSEAVNLNIGPRHWTEQGDTSGKYYGYRNGYVDFTAPVFEWGDDPYEIIEPTASSEGAAI